MTQEKLTENPEKARVLIVEDDEDLNWFLTEALKTAGYETISAFDGASALEMAAKHLPHIVLVDLMLPDIGGMRVCETLKKTEATSSTPIIIISGKSDIHTKLDSFLKGADRYLTKPFDVETLIDEIKKTLRQRMLSETVRDYHDRCDDDHDYGVFNSRLDACM